MGRQLGVDSAYVGRVMSQERTSIGIELVARAARAFGVSSDYFFAAGPDDLDPSGFQGSSQTRMERPSRYPSLDATIAYWAKKRPDRWSTSTIEAARSVSLESDEDRSVAEWEGILDGIEAIVRRGLPPAVSPDDDPAPPRGKH